MSLVVENEREWNGTHKEKFGMKEIQNLSFKILFFAKKKKKKKKKKNVTFLCSFLSISSRHRGIWRGESMFNLHQVVNTIENDKMVGLQLMTCFY
jgi:hypothetical protein